MISQRRWAFSEHRSVKRLGLLERFFGTILLGEKKRQQLIFRIATVEIVERGDDVRFAAEIRQQLGEQLVRRKTFAGLLGVEVWLKQFERLGRLFPHIFKTSQ